MIIVTEKHNGNEIFFTIETSIKGSTNYKDIYYRTAIREKDGFTYLLLYSPEMEPIHEVFSFLNYDKAGQSINSRLKSLQAMKLLYCYQDVISKKLDEFTVSDINGLKLFLRGISPKGESIKFNISTSRNSETINGYLSVYRQFLSYNGRTNEALMMKSAKKTLISLPDSEIDYGMDHYTMNEKTPKRVVEIPKYISVEEFQKIINEIRANYTIREEIVVRFMYQCGLRIGEVLGITADDLVMEMIDGIYCPVLYIRNRCSDKAFQNAKTCMKVTNPKQYRSKEYNTKGYGYQTVVLPEDLYSLVNEYIEEAHSWARETKKENYYESTIADRVRKAEPFEDDNYYVIINSLGRPLSQISWNNTIREIFIKLGIPIDKETRSNNLNHKFRHGFAMFNVKYLKCNELQLKERMRHNSLQSVAAYFKPTISDAIEVKTDFTRTLYDIIPELKR